MTTTKERQNDAAEILIVAGKIFIFLQTLPHPRSHNSALLMCTAIRIAENDPENMDAAAVTDLSARIVLARIIKKLLNKAKRKLH